MQIKEFQIKSFPGPTFRTKRVSPIKLLALQTQIDLDNFNKVEALYTFVLENLEVKTNENNWMSVKTPGKDTLLPIGIEDNLTALNELIGWYAENVIQPTFTESRE